VYRKDSHEQQLRWRQEAACQLSRQQPLLAICPGGASCPSSVAPGQHLRTRYSSPLRLQFPYLCSRTVPPPPSAWGGGEMQTQRA
jgi:hypothetical protein